ncbi:hypothetical protein FDP41_010357 [Naegleria fowleri]|uniref:EXS domain-containing protein n=1 Tax=Naegleria fowleri TaxID=5763 RepID=A0A6A5C8M8_NAEFO|nr:uncharacterized protein FDP41_010357 [Naegleria fowleri]KAF0983292.1 hypothetical protein FDP41_010357 [Naegleria fowleri]
MIHFYHHSAHNNSNLSDDEDSSPTQVNHDREDDDDDGSNENDDTTTTTHFTSRTSPLNILASSYDDSTLQQQFYSSMVVEWQLKYLDFKFLNDRLKNIQEELKQQLKKMKSSSHHDSLPMDPTITHHLDATTSRNNNNNNTLTTRWTQRGGGSSGSSSNSNVNRQQQNRSSIRASLYRVFTVGQQQSPSNRIIDEYYYYSSPILQELVNDFKYLLYKELNKINSFYTQQENSMSVEHDRLLEQIERINEMYHDRQYASSLLSSSSMNPNKLQILTFNQRQKLKEGLEEHYYNLNLLLNYRLVNFNALIYLCTKLEEIIKRRVKWSFNEMNEVLNIAQQQQDATTNTNNEQDATTNTNNEQDATTNTNHNTNNHNTNAHSTMTTTTTPTNVNIITTSTNNDDNTNNTHVIPDQQHSDSFKLSKFIKSQYFKHSKIVEHHIRDTVEYYAEYFYEKDTKAAIEALGKMMRGNGILRGASGGGVGGGGGDGGFFSNSSMKDVFSSGLLLGTLIILIGVNVFYYFHTYEFAPNLAERIDYNDQSFSLYRLILFPVMLAFLIAVNIRIWSKHSINYVFILGLNPLMSLQTFRFLSITLLMLNIIFLSQLLYMMNTVSYLYGIMDIGKYAYWHPIVLWILLFVYLFNPFKILNFEFRYWFLKCVLRMLASPFTAVRFSDFFIADQLTSLGDVLFELQFIACIYPATSQSKVMKLFCDSTKSIGIPILNYIPYHCRLMQCLRKYYDTRQKMHLLNALKYASSCLVVVIAFIDKLVLMMMSSHSSEGGGGGGEASSSQAYWTALRILWLIVNIFSTCLKLYWDLKIDMGLLESCFNSPIDMNGISIFFKRITSLSTTNNNNSTTTNLTTTRRTSTTRLATRSSSSSSLQRDQSLPLLRRKLIFSPIYYYMAMIANIVLRWVWLPFVFVKAFVPVEQNTLEWLLYALIALELLRRFIWNIFRVEHENLANIENYRATKEIPLPFDTTTSSSRIEQVQSKKNFYMDLKRENEAFTASSWLGKVMGMAKSMLLCFGKNDVDNEDIWIIDEEELERLRRENAKRPNLKIQLTLPFDLETLRREFGQQQQTTATTTLNDNADHNDNDGADHTSSTTPPSNNNNYTGHATTIQQPSDHHAIIMMEDDSIYDLENDKLL